VVLITAVNTADAQRRGGGIAATFDSPDGVTVLQYRTKQDGNWNDAATWEQSADGTTWVPTVTFPTSANSSTVTIRSGTHVTLTGNDSVNSLSNFGFIQGSGNMTVTGDFDNIFFNSSTGTFTFSGVNNTQVLTNLLAQNVVIAHTGTGGVQTVGNPNVNHLLRVATGTFTTGGSTSCVNVEIDSGATMAMAPGATIEVASDWANHGTFTANGGDVYLDGQLTGLVSGSTTFSGLVLGSGIPNAKLTFEAGSTQTVTRLLQMQGDTGTPTRLKLRSSIEGVRWNINVLAGSSQAIAYVDVRDSNASGGQTLVANGNSFDAGNNLNWTGFSVTAADVSLSGRVVSAEGRGITNAVISVSGVSLASPIFVTAGRNGAYRFDGLQAGETYAVTVYARRFSFGQASRIITLNDDLTGVDFIGRSPLEQRVKPRAISR
jgi:hypothetical protein